MRLLVLVFALSPLSAFAQLGQPPSPTKGLFWDARVSAGGAAAGLRTTAGQERLYGGAVGGQGAITYRGGTVGLSALLGADLVFPFNLPSGVRSGFGLVLYPFGPSPSFLRLTGGPAAVIGPNGGLGFASELELQVRGQAGLGFSLGLGGYLRQTSLPYAQIWGGRLVLGVTFGAQLTSRR